MTKPEHCLCCGAERWADVLSIDGFHLVACRACRLFALQPTGSSGEGDYASSLQMEAYTEYMRPLRTQQYRAELRQISRYVGSGRLLDVGCALGWFIGEARAAGFAADGLEPQADLAAIAAAQNPDAGVSVGEVGMLAGARQRYDVITMWSVVEHFVDPEGALAQLRECLAERGLLALRTPNSLGLAERVSVLLFKLTGGRIRGPLEAVLQLPFASKHWWLFSPANLTALLGRSGFTVLEVYYSTSVDWRHLDTWLRSRNMRPALPVVLAMKLFFFVNEQLGRLGLADDFVMIARKN